MHAHVYYTYMYINTQDYKVWCTRYLDNLHQSEEEQMTREDKIYQTWTDSVTAIQKLYQ